MRPVVSRNVVQSRATHTDDKFTLSYDDSLLEQMYDDSRIRREIGQYIQELREQGLTQRYIDQQKGTLLRFLEHCREQGIHSTSNVTTDIVLSFCEKYNRFSASYQQQVWVAIRKFLAYMDNPALLNIRPKIRGTSRTNVDWLTTEESAIIMNTPMSPRESLLIGGGLLQGLRRIEILRITKKDAQDALRTGILRVRGKGYKERAIPLQTEFANILQNYLAIYDIADDQATILPIQRTQSERILSKFCERVGKKFSFHTLRRSFGRNLWLLGNQIELISQLLGHSSVDMTRKYLGIDQSDMRQALACYFLTSDCPMIQNPEI